MSTRLTCIVASVALGIASLAAAEDVYYSVPMRSLEVSPVASSPAPTTRESDRQRSSLPSRGYATLDGGGEVYLTDADRSWNPQAGRETLAGNMVVCVPAGAAVAGRVFLPTPDSRGMTAVTFKLDPAATSPDARQAFLSTKEAHYRNLANDGIAGTAWFRHQADAAARELHGQAGNLPATNAPQRWRGNRDDPEELYALFTGGRAVSENLQLDRALPVAPTTRPASQPADDKVDINTLTGITVREMDWTALLGSAKPKLDPLAALIPADQHAVFFPTFAAAIAVADEADAHGTPVLHAMSPRAEDARTIARYERQLCLSMTGLARLLGPQVIKSIALTGSDPYYVSGTDLAMLFEASNPQGLKTLLLAQVALAAHTQTGGQQPVVIREQIAGVEVNGVRSADRTVSCYVAILGSAVVVTNSPAQLERLAAVHQGKLPALASAPEYQYFRVRYPVDDKDESALLVLSDATIRRWCGPRWRIASARRTLALASLTELQAQHLEDIEHHRSAAKLVNPGLLNLGDLAAASNDITSSVYGSTAFMTPIVELNMAAVTPGDAAMYERWRDTYQRNWRQFFDPIALRLCVKPGGVAADLTVTPLIAATQYREMIEITRGARIAPTAGDPHPDLVHLVMAINRESRMARQAGSFAAGMAANLRVDPLGWIGQSISLYVDESPLWRELAQAESPDRFLEEHVWQLPVALNVEVSDGLKLVAFLTAMRAFAEQSSPGMTFWEVINYKDVAYVKVSQANAGQQQGGHEPPAIYYAATPGALILSFNEGVLQHALDRQALRRAVAAAATQPAPATQPAVAMLPVEKPWLGQHFNGRITRAGLAVIEPMLREGYQTAMRQASWRNIPILNEWKRRFPDQDPLALHETYWQTRLVCPGGGTYVWNREWQTMESTVYGHPGQPKDGPKMPVTLAALESAIVGLTFEDQGLRAQVELDRGQPAPGKPAP